jgi:glucosamine--fructose-6-phosphate aminotransferase (isomerizing)
MCGIVGTVGAEGGVLHDTVERLASMEYRGYDSYGLACLDADGRIAVRKDVGSVGRAAQAGRFDDMAESLLAVAHTRWATHGGVTAANAHPHLSDDATVAVVHNGVIKNYQELRRRLEAEGVTFRSETDSEVAAHLIAWHLRLGAGVLDAVARTTAQLDGEYALAVVTLADPQAVYGARHKSPLVVSHNGRHGIVASDQMALRGMDTMVVLDDGDLVRVTASAIEMFTALDGQVAPASRAAVALDDRQQDAQLGDYPHWMLKEINDVPAAVRTVVDLPSERFAGVVPPAGPRPVTLVGAGSAFYVAQIAQYLLAGLARVPAVALPSDEAPYLAQFQPGDTVIAVSQSGETFDTLEVVRAAVEAGAVLTSICNVPSSTQERLATHRIRQGSGPEVCVLSTKSIVSQLVILARLALETGRAGGTLTPPRYQAHLDSLRRLPATLRRFIDDQALTIHDLAKKHSHVEDWFFIGRGPLYPAACESALKFKEVSYRHAEGMGAGFFKHGTISLIDADFYTVALLPSRQAAPERYAATLVAVSEIAARGGPVIGIGPEDADPDDRAAFTDYLPLPYHGDDVADVVLQLVAGQMLAYYCALDLGREIDQPRSLAKSVTVR